MNFSNVEFLKSVGLGMEKVFFDDDREIVFLGRSNVGKSSIMNALFSKKDLVKTSSRPGKTKLANIFKVENKFLFTDLPGYGFAKVGKEMQEELDGLISWYLEEKRYNIKKAIILIDSKIGPQQKDIDMYEFLNSLEIPVLIILSKVDKLSLNEQNKSLAFAKKEFYGQDILLVSSAKKTNISELQRYIKNVLISK